MPVQIKGRHALAPLLLPLRLMPGGNEAGLLHHPHHRRMRALAVLGIPAAIAVEVADDDAALVDLLAVNAVVDVITPRCTASPPTPPEDSTNRSPESAGSGGGRRTPTAAATA